MIELPEQFEQHEHNGSDSKKIKGKNLAKAPQNALTAKSSSAFSTGGAAVLSTADQTIFDNMRTRINELESRLQKLDLLR